MILKFNITLARPYAVAYGGHQFGFYGGQLGDGRCISLGQVIAKNQNLIELSIKGTGKTPYSRLGDGFCTVSSSVREFLAAEFMAKLGVPTTRSLSIIAENKMLSRTMNGVEVKEYSARVCRIAESWLRFGNFELFW